MGDEISFYVTLSSGASKNYYPENSNSDFKNHLPMVIDGNYEVGLTQLLFFDTFDPVIPVPPQPAPVPDPDIPTFFNNNAKDATVLVKRNSPVYVLECKKKENDPVESFVADINVQLLLLNNKDYSVLLKQHIVKGEATIELVFVNENKSNILKLSNGLNHILGLKDSEFRAGNYQAETSLESTFCRDAYENFLKDQVANLEMFTHQELSFQIKEPSKFEIDLLADNVILAFEENGVSISFFRMFDNTMKLESETTKSIQFSKRLNRILNLDQDYVFTDSDTTFDVPVNLVPTMNQPASPESLTPPAEVQINPNLLLIVSNVAEPQRFEGGLARVLRVINRPRSEESFVELNFNPVHYLPFSGLDQSTVHIQLVDEGFQPLERNYSTTTVILHFRRIRY